MKTVAPFLLVPALLLGACSTTPAEREALREGVISQALVLIEQLQAYDKAKLEVDPEVLIVANGACIALKTVAPFAVVKLNAQIDNPEAQVTAAEIVGTIDGVCAVVQALMVEKAPKPEAVPVPAVAEPSA